MDAYLDRLRADHIEVHLEGDHIRASGPLTDELRQYIRDHRAQIVADLRIESALRIGALVICETCEHFRPRPGMQPDGYCGHLSEVVWARVPFDCPDYRKRGTP